MYYLVYAFFYLLSLLPFRVMYWLSDGVYFLVYHVFRYRKQLVFDHLRYTFPEKSDAEIKVIKQKFFLNFTDTWVEMIKTLSMTRAEAARRIKCEFSLLDRLYAQGKSVQVVGGHFINWEYIPVAVPMSQPFTALAIFMPLSNKILDRLVYKLRSRFGLVLLRAGNMQVEMEPWHDRKYLMLVGADQSPSNPEGSYWLNFCNRPTGFIRGPWIRAARQHIPYVYFRIRKPKRGYYTFAIEEFEEDPHGKDPDAIARKYVATLEADIREAPELYLWTHNRWKRPWKPEYKSKWIDTCAPPSN